MAIFIVPDDKFDVHTGDYESEARERKTKQAISDLRDTIIKLNAVPFLDGKLIKDVALPSSGTSLEVEHGLGRAWQGWWIVKTDALFEARNAVSQTDPEMYVTIGLDAAVSAGRTADFWVF